MGVLFHDAASMSPNKSDSRLYPETRPHGPLKASWDIRSSAPLGNVIRRAGRAPPGLGIQRSRLLQLHGFHAGRAHGGMRAPASVACSDRGNGKMHRSAAWIGSLVAGSFAMSRILLGRHSRVPDGGGIGRGQPISWRTITVVKLSELQCMPSKCPA